MTLVKTKRVQRAPTTHRQRMGLHHRHSHHYLKTYWPYLPIVLIMLMGPITSQWLWQTHKNVLGYATDMSVASLLNDTNAQRTTFGKAPLAINIDLSSAAQAKANDMAVRDYWSHDTPDGKTPWSFITASGYTYQLAGENLAYGFATAADTVTGWMNSPEHRANILNASYKDVGFGIANVSRYQQSGPETIVVAMYALAATAPITEATSPTLPTAMATTAPASSSSAQIQLTEPAQQLVSHVQIVANGSIVALAIVLVVGASGFAFLLLRHGLRWRKVMVRGEAFILHHPSVDITVVVIVTIAVILTRAAGFIR